MLQTVGTMLSASYQAGPALIGAIFGTGTNGAYLEDLVNIKKLGADFIKEQAIKTGPKMIINTEWGALDNNVSGWADELLLFSTRLPLRFSRDKTETDRSTSCFTFVFFSDSLSPSLSSTESWIERVSTRESISLPSFIFASFASNR